MSESGQPSEPTSDLVKSKIRPSKEFGRTHFPGFAYVYPVDTAIGERQAFLSSQSVSAVLVCSTVFSTVDLLTFTNFSFTHFFITILVVG